MAARPFIRILVGASLCVAVAVFVSVSVPTNAHGAPALPAIAVGQVGLYRLEVALLVFYGGLLLITPAFSGLARGRLPIEISARGAKFAVEVDQQPESTEAEIEELREATKRLVDEIAVAQLDIERLKRQPGDGTQHEVRSEND
jgi:hypothetical protein